MGTLRVGDMALATGEQARWYSWLIRVGTRSRYSHVRLVIDPDGTTVEATDGGVRYGRVQPTDVVLRPPLLHHQRALIPGIAADLIGTPYGWVDVTVLGLAQVGIRLPGLSKQIERPDRLFCSQLVDHVWRLAGYQAFDDGRQPQNVSPGDLADVMLRHHSVIQTTVRKTSTRLA